MPSVAEAFGFAATVPVSGQTYTRKFDSQIVATLAGFGESAHRFGSDLRLLAHEREVEEPFEAEQIGSSAMAYKRNPMRAERISGLARFVISLQANAAHTAAAQWLERTLDDSANRRLTLPEAFLGTDAILVLAGTRLDTDPKLCDLVAQYWRLVPDEELAGNSPAAMLAADAPPGHPEHLGGGVLRSRPRPARRAGPGRRRGRRRALRARRRVVPGSP